MIMYIAFISDQVPRIFYLLYCITAYEKNNIKQYRKILFISIFVLYVIYIIMMCD